MDQSSAIENIQALIEKGDYEHLVIFLEEQIENQSQEIIYYLYLGLAYLLQEKETEAQATWLLVMGEGDDLQVEEWTADLLSILEKEAIHQSEVGNFHLSWLIRGHIREIEPNIINNLLHLINLEIQLKYYESQHLENWKLIDIFKQSSSEDIDYDLFIKIMSGILSIPAYVNLDLLYVFLKYIPESDQERFLSTLENISINMAYEQHLENYAIELSKVALTLQPNNLKLLDNIFWFSSMAKDYELMITSAEKFLELATDFQLKAFGHYKILSTQVSRGAWFEIKKILPNYIKSLQRMIANKPQSINPLLRGCIHSMTSSLLYIEDSPLTSRNLQNHLSNLFHEFLPNWMPWSSSRKVILNNNPKILKIGYISHTLRRHSVGWLSRWLITYHDREKFDVTLYLINQKEDDLTQTWFREKVNCTYNLPHFPLKIATQIEQDEIDILVDLDSFSHAITCQVLSLKPAPIQITWLGFDASGLPPIDYFIADPYVLPDNAQEYYREKIWRLPQTYLAVDGFEVATPTLRREELGIDNNTIIYMTVQGGVKRHPDTIALQMQILQEVTDSCLLIKGNADQTVIQPLFNSIAEEYGIALNRLHFLEMCPLEETHRANLSIADVILDTYPYNGATTTLEALWMELPIVTKVGKQFAARNSYTFMINAGITEGIAQTDREYVDWGIKLGLDEALRQDIHWKLRQSKKTAPLWNARQFTQEMEKAYQQMWLRYLEAQS